MSESQVATDTATRILASLHSTGPVKGLTHNFYRYPARMPPPLAREIIRHFSQPHDVVFDPFLGGGTTMVEAVAAGRRAVGVDLNPLATFVATAKTTPLSRADRCIVERWVRDVVASSNTVRAVKPSRHGDPKIKNLPDSLVPIFDHALEHISAFPFPRQQRFARCALLRLGQWAVDGRRTIPDPSAVREALPTLVEEMFSGLDQLVAEAREHGVQKQRLTRQRLIIQRSAVGLENDRLIETSGLQPTLVLTSPPYPAIHVLYHRWQVYGRRETPAPYWIVGAPDGRGASYFTFGSRTPFGIDNYFKTLVEAYRSVRAVVAPGALVVQLVAFADVDKQLPAFLTAMATAGFREETPIMASRSDLWRTVPNRKWYCRVGTARDAMREILLFHRSDSGA